MIDWAKWNKFWPRLVTVIGYLFILAIIIAYVLFSSQSIPSLKEYSNPVSNALFAIINLLVSIYLAYKIALISEGKEQKSLAIRSVRHLRTHLRSLRNLKDIVTGYIDSIQKKDDIARQYLVEFRNHIDNITHGIAVAEADFKDILEDEFETENQMVLEIYNKFDQMAAKQKAIEDLQKQDSQDKKKEIEKLRSEIHDLNSGIRLDMFKLPIDSTSGTSVASGEAFIGWDEHNPIKFHSSQRSAFMPFVPPVITVDTKDKK